MPTSKVDIANLALTKLGSNEKLTSLSDNSVAARAMNRLYDPVRQAELRRRHWSFSIVRTSVAASATTPDWGFGYAYPLPADFLRAVPVSDYFVVPSLSDYTSQDASAFAFEVVGGVRCIVTDFTAPLKLRYVYDVTDEGQFDPLFVMAFAARLAFEACEQITNSNTKKQACQQDYQMSVREALAANAIEKPPQPFADDSWVIARL